MRSIYLDHAATTPLDASVLNAMLPYLQGQYGNPSSVHRLGQTAKMAIEESRDRIAQRIAANSREIVFTSGGTESDNAAIRGLALAPQSRGRHVVTTSIEHEAVLETCQDLQTHFGFEVTRIPPDSDGIIPVEAIEDSIRPDTSLVSVMYANNEIGTVQPIREIGCVCRDRGVPFHVDAVQAVGSVPLDVVEENVDLMSFSAHKFYGPKGVGGLFVRRGVRWQPQQVGGGQERLRRSGTENVAGIVGMATALDRASDLMNSTSEHVTRLREMLFAEILASIPGSVVNGSRLHRLPGNVNLSFPSLSGESLVIALDSQGIMASSGSACSSGSVESSHVLTAIGRDEEYSSGALRMTLGRENTEEEMREAARQICTIVERLTTEQAAKKSVRSVKV